MRKCETQGAFFADWRKTGQNQGSFEGLKQSIKPGGTYSCAETAKDIEITMKTYKQIFYYKKYTMRGISSSTRF